MIAFGSIWLLAIAWCFLQGSVSLGNLILGGLISTTIFLISDSYNGMGNSLSQLKAGIRLLFFILKDLVVSSLRVGWDIVTPTIYARPRIVRIPIDDLDDVAITVLANAISLTPGSLALEVKDDRQSLYVHLMYAEDRDAAVKAIYIDLGNKVRAACAISEKTEIKS
jgi:multicomponent Na+:H+ antiporter subunit E